jgi:hypothetical protein
MALDRFAELYAALGGIVAVLFLAFGVTALPGARGAYAFRPLLLPGLILLWPLVLWRWWRLARPRGLGRRYTATHRAVWLALSVLLPLAFLAALWLRQGGPLDAASIRLAAP